MRTLTILFLTFIVTVFNVAQAANDYSTYVGLQVGQADADDGFDELEFDYRLLRLGFMPTENTSIEYRIGRGNSDDMLGDVRWEMENIHGVYGLYHFNFSENGSIYGALGYSETSFKASGLDASGQPASAQIDDRGLSFGAGVQFYGVNVEYMRYLDTTDLEVEAVAIGFNYKLN